MPSSADLPDVPLSWAWQPLPRGVSAEPLARAWLAGKLDAGARALAIRRDPRGRPRLEAPFAGYDCNWSHSGEGLLVVLGQDLQVGADMEWLRPRPRALALAQRYFTPAEALWLGALDAPARELAFLRLWCAKESVLKAHGQGLAFGLDRIEFHHRAGRLSLAGCDAALGRPEDWSLREIEPAPGYLGALAWRRPPG